MVDLRGIEPRDDRIASAVRYPIDQALNSGALGGSRTRNNWLLEPVTLPIGLRVRNSTRFLSNVQIVVARSYELGLGWSYNAAYLAAILCLCNIK